MSPSSPNVLSLFRIGTRSLRESVIARADPAAQGAGFAASLERRADTSEQAGVRQKADKRRDDQDQRSEDRLNAEDADDAQTGGAERTTGVDEAGKLVAKAGQAANPLTPDASPGVDSQAAPGVTPPDPSDLARELAVTSVAAQAKTGPVTAQILTELSLQGQAVGRFALVSPKFKPGAVSSAASDPSTGQPVPSAAIGPTASAETSAAPQPGATPTDTGVLAPAAQRPASGAPAPSAVAPLDPAPRASPAKPDVRPEPASRLVDRPTDASAAQPGGQSRQEGSSRQDQSGRQSEASVRGLDALLGRPASKARATQAADPSANRALAAQLERGVSAALSSRDGVVTLRLSPEQLGPLKVRVSVDKGAVKAAFEASSPQAKQAVEQSIPSLKEALAAKGLTVERIEVTLAQPLPQRELGLSAQASFEQPPAGLGNASVGDQSSPHRGRDGSSDDRPSSDRASNASEQIALDLSPIEQTGFRYITTPDGRLGVVALA